MSRSHICRPATVRGMMTPRDEEKIMLARNSYPADYVAAARASLEARVATYRAMVAAGEGAGFDAAVKVFEPVFFNDLVLVLENYFVHRLRNAEGKDGNALNEVRLLSAALMGNDGRFAVDKQTRWRPEGSVLGYAPGDEIAVREDDFRRLADAFLAEIAARYPA